MKSQTLPIVLNIFSIICGIWFCLTSWAWIFLANIFFSFPVGAVGFVLWLVARQMDPSSKTNKAAIIIHIIGVVLSLVALVVMVYIPRWK